MSPPSILRTLNGPIPTPFTGDLAHAVQFIQNLNSLVWKNLNHPLISTPWTRIDMALSLISGPETLTWRRSVRCGLSTEATIDTLWEDFVESFCEAWVYSPESTISAVAPAVQISTDVPSPSPAAASTLKRVEDISTVLTTDELPPRHLSETIDQTADEDDADDRTSFSPHTALSAPPPFIAIIDQTLPTRKPRPASPIVSLLDLVKPVNEPPHLLYAPIHPAPVSPVPASTESRAEDISIVLAAHEDPAVPSPAISNESLMNDCALPTPPRSANMNTTQIMSTRTLVNAPIPNLHVAAALCHDSTGTGLSAPVRLYPSSPSVHLATPRRAVLHNAINLATTVACDAANLAFPTPLSPHRSSSPPRLPSRPVSPPILSSLDVGINDNVLKKRGIDLKFDPLPCSPAAFSPRIYFSSIQLLSLRSPFGFPLDVGELPPGALPDLTLHDIHDPADIILSASHPPPTSSALAISFPRPPVSVVEDDNRPTRGVKTIETSVLTSDIVSLTSQIKYYPPIFLPRACERPREPDEVAPAIPLTNNQRRYTVATVAHPPSAVQSPATPRHTNTARRAPRPVDSRISNEQPPDALAKRRAVDEFLNAYDAARTVQKPTPAKDDRAYDAIIQHLDRWLWRDPERAKTRKRKTPNRHNFQSSPGLTAPVIYAKHEYATHAKNDGDIRRKAKIASKIIRGRMNQERGSSPMNRKKTGTGPDRNRLQPDLRLRFIRPENFTGCGSSLIWKMGEPLQGRLGPVPTGLYSHDQPRPSDNANFDNADQMGTTTTLPTPGPDCCDADIDSSDRPQQRQPQNNHAPSPTTTNDHDHQHRVDNHNHNCTNNLANNTSTTTATIKTITHRQPQGRHIDNGDTSTAATSTNRQRRRSASNNNTSTTTTTTHRQPATTTRRTAATSTRRQPPAATSSHQQP
ncbi:hypothetical protein EDB84DRAFT_1680107 [Lactarius hengduanensis]|nr:hypothetical protein EDB84DRAFT_1680107 [Lactarius hengduanensis]